MVTKILRKRELKLESTRVPHIVKTRWSTSLIYPMKSQIAFESFIFKHIMANIYIKQMRKRGIKR